MIGELRWALDARRRNARWIERRAERCGTGLQAEGRPRISRGGERTRLLIGDDVYLYYDLAFFLDGPGATISIGDRTYLNRRTEVICQQSVSIGADCLISWDVSITDTDYHHVGDAPVTQPVVIEDLAWIGCRATILKGVTVGEGAVVAAGAVVSDDVPARTLVAGVPARVLRRDVTWS